jgi:hypothetical protein
MYKLYKHREREKKKTMTFNAWNSPTHHTTMASKLLCPLASQPKSESNAQKIMQRKRVLLRGGINFSF